MNIHPAFVHFPIALLLVYALIEIFPMRRVMASVAWDVIKLFLLYVGTLAAVVTAITGEMAEELVGESPDVDAHAIFAISLVVVALITSAVSYFWKTESRAKAIVMKLMAAAIFLLLFIVGSLGANIVYGSDVDPVVQFVTGILGVQ